MTTPFEAWPQGSPADKTKIRGLLSDVSIAAKAFDVTSRNLGTPPSNPSFGDAYIIAAAPTGAWSGHENYIAHWDGSEWRLIAPIGVANISNESESLIVYWNGTEWASLAAGENVATTDDIATAVAALEALIDDKANDPHDHEIDDITGLQDELDDKSPDVHGHAISDLPITVSTAQPSGGADGDLWFVREA
jgi:Protein of unknown function (DUF2793)/Phage tail repeat like